MRITDSPVVKVQDKGDRLVTHGKKGALELLSGSDRQHLEERKKPHPKKNCRDRVAHHQARAVKTIHACWPGRQGGWGKKRRKKG